MFDSNYLSSKLNSPQFRLFPESRTSGITGSSSYLAHTIVVDKTLLFQYKYTI
jgi:hypothetical protein